jgi:Tol biopolymer transport system component
MSNTTAPVDGPAGRIAYTVQNPHTDRMDVVIYNLATNSSWPVLANQRQPDFNNQSDLAVNGEGGNMDNLLLMRPPDERLAIISAFAEDAHPHWAPSNKMIVFDSTLVGDGRHRLYLQHDTNYGQAVGPMMYDAWEIFGEYPVFLLDGRIAYNGCDVWENASTCGVFIVDVNGGKPVNLTQWPRDIPTDNLGYGVLMMSDRTGDWNVYLADPATGAVAQLTTDPATDGLATASPDGSYIAFITDREGRWSVYVMRMDGSDQRKLFDMEGGYGWGDRDWIQERLSWGR